MYNVFGCCSLKETENLLIIWCKIEIYFTRDHRKANFFGVRHFHLTPTFNKYPLYIVNKGHMPKIQQIIVKYLYIDIKIQN